MRLGAYYYVCVNRSEKIGHGWHGGWLCIWINSNYYCIRLRKCGTLTSLLLSLSFLYDWKLGLRWNEVGTQQLRPALKIILLSYVMNIHRHKIYLSTECRNKTNRKFAGNIFKISRWFSDIWSLRNTWKLFTEWT